jgi:hypothetical protein
LGAGGSAVAIIVGTGVLGWLFDGYGTPSEKRWPLYIQMGLVYMGIIFGILISLKSRLMGEMCFLGWLASMCGALISGRIYLNKNEPGQRSKEPLALLIETLVLGGIGYVAVQLFIWTMR